MLMNSVWQTTASYRDLPADGYNKRMGWRCKSGEVWFCVDNRDCYRWLGNAWEDMGDVVTIDNRGRAIWRWP
jgi:hypothetical protein